MKHVFLLLLALSLTGCVVYPDGSIVPDPVIVRPAYVSPVVEQPVRTYYNRGYRHEYYNRGYDNYHRQHNTVIINRYSDHNHWH